MTEKLLVDPDCRAGKHDSCVGGPCQCLCHDTTQHDPTREALVRIAERQTLGVSALADVADSRLVHHLEAPMRDIPALLMFARDALAMHRPLRVFAGDLACLEDGQCADPDDPVDLPCPHTEHVGTVCGHCSYQEDHHGGWPRESQVPWPCPTRRLATRHLTEEDHK